MTGFAPLIEGFLAFALTMLALTTAVSAVVAAVNQARRRHARGLRDMVRLLYRRELAPLDPEHARRSDEDKLMQRAKFIYDLTFAPVPDVVEKLETEGEGYWLEKLVSAERLVGSAWWETIRHPKRLGRRWQTLRYSLASLPDNEFLERLAASNAGVALNQQQAWARHPHTLTSWDELAARFLTSFQAIGGASSETFSRHSRRWSVAVGFLLAITLNIDSLDLLNSYLTDPALRQQVITQSDDLQNQLDEIQANAAADQDVVQQTREQILDVTRALGSSFPIGWNRFPHCQDETADLRCIGLPLETAAANRPGWYETTTWLRAWLPARWNERWTALIDTRSADPAAFGQWVIGVLLTGLLLGLGTPFWVQAVNAAFNLRRWTNGREHAGKPSAPPRRGPALRRSRPPRAPHPPRSPNPSASRRSHRSRGSASILYHPRAPRDGARCRHE